MKINRSSVGIAAVSSRDCCLCRFAKFPLRVRELNEASTVIQYIKNYKILDDSVDDCAPRIATEIPQPWIIPKLSKYASGSSAIVCFSALMTAARHFERKRFHAIPFSGARPPHGRERHSLQIPVANQQRHFEHTVGETPFVVVPTKNSEQPAGCGHRKLWSADY